MLKSKYIFFTFIGLSSFLFLQGCIVTQSDIGILKTQIAALNKSLEDVQRNQVSVDQQMGDITVQLTQSVDNLNNFDYKIDSISTKLDNISAMLEGGKNFSYQMLPGDIFIQAKSQFDAAQYEQAANGFSLYIKNAPEGQNVEEAYILLSDSYYNTKEYQKAAVSAATLLEKFPASRYTPNARVLYARSILPLNKKDEAATYLKSVMQDFKNTPAAADAKKILEEIK
jgi:TolA-binding protein